jgi:thioredoxin:protein disulfide reductase
LAGALLYISQTRDVVVGGGALFAMAAGMSVPLLLVGVSGAILPRSGVWMDEVKRFFGVLLLAVALWMVAPVLPAWLQMLGWSLLGLGYGGYLLWNERSRWAAKALALAFAAFGLLQLIGLASGGRDPWMPLDHLRAQQTPKAAFTRIKSVEELDAVLTASHGKTVMLDFYADWCVSCIEMEKLTFPDPRVQKRFADMLLIQVDVTANDEQDKAMLKRFKLFGPPAIVFFDKDGKELTNARVIGYQNADRFAKTLGSVVGR